MRASLRTWLFLLLAVLVLHPAVSPGLALGAGVAYALVLGEPLVRWRGRAARVLLQLSVVGLGFGLPVGAVLAAGAAGAVYTVVGVAATLALGLLLGRLLRVEGRVSFLVTAGTGICGGSAIAAVGPVIGAAPHAMGVALATVFVLNAVALYLFPLVGAALHLTEPQFAVWAAVAIHDTSSVVGAAASYGSEALRLATVLKLARALWIFPLVAAAAAWMRWRRGSSPGRLPAFPWFILAFVAAAAARSLAGEGALPVLEGAVAVARRLLVLTLLLIGAGMSAGALRRTGWRPLAMGVLLWTAVSLLTLAWVLRGVAL